MAGSRPTEPDPAATELTAAEAAWLSKLGVSTIYARIRSGELEAVWTGGTVRVPRDAAVALTRKRASVRNRTHRGEITTAANAAA